ncbi:MAG: hypothetical protein JWQ96_733 [Segetibacter sp.]|nr:hypothetical protein [Segetibacter sp.]
MEKTNNIREKLHDYVDKGDDKLVKLMYALAKEYNEDEDLDFQFGEEQIKEFDDRREKRLRRESRTYSLEETKEIITGKKK